MSRTLPDWQNPDVLHIGREEPRASLIPFLNEKAALSGERGLSGCYRLLNGQWDFFYSPAGPAPFPDLDEHVGAASNDLGFRMFHAETNRFLYGKRFV